MIASIYLAQVSQRPPYGIVRVAGISNANIVAGDNSVFGFDYSRGTGWPAVWKDGKVTRLVFGKRLFYKGGTWSSHGPKGFDARLCSFWADSSTYMAGSCQMSDFSVARNGTLFVIDTAQFGNDD